MEDKYDSLKFSYEKSIVKRFQNGQSVFMSCSIFKFNDYKKKQKRNFLITNCAVYNLDQTQIKRKILLQNIKGVSVSKIGTQFVIHVPSEYDYRYASSDLRDKIIYYLLKGIRIKTKEKLPIYYRDQLNLAFYSMTKEDKKKNEKKQIKGRFSLHDDQTYFTYLKGEEQEKQMVRNSTKTLFSQNFEEQITINDFIPKVNLGKGAFGTVILVQKRDTKELFAMKSILKDEIVKKDQLEHTKAEKMILEHVNHPFLVNLVYAFQTPSKIYFIMQFMRGGQLFQHLSKLQRFPEKQVKFYAMQISLGLGHLHEKDFIYRDLKLQNILMDQYGNVSLTDFGMAKIIRDGELANTFCGTPQYLAPEVIDRMGYDKSADWWSLGILVYEMIFGLPPFYHKAQQEMFRRIKQDQVKFSEKVKASDSLKDLIRRLLDKNPKTRLGSKGQVKEILSHPWFKDLDRQKVFKKQIKSPYMPKVEGQDWLDGFDKQFTSQKAVFDDKGQKVEGEKCLQFQTIFKGF